MLRRPHGDRTIHEIKNRKVTARRPGGDRTATLRLLQLLEVCRTVWGTKVAVRPPQTRRKLYVTMALVKSWVKSLPRREKWPWAIASTFWTAGRLRPSAGGPNVKKTGPMLLVLAYYGTFAVVTGQIYQKQNGQNAKWPKRPKSQKAKNRNG